MWPSFVAYVLVQYAVMRQVAAGSFDVVVYEMPEVQIRCSKKIPSKVHLTSSQSQEYCG